MDICCEQKRIREFLFFPTDLLNHNNKNGAGQTVQIIVFCRNHTFINFVQKYHFLGKILELLLVHQ